MISPHTMKTWDRIFALLWFMLVTVLLCIPGNNLPETQLDKIPFFDKYVHIGLFAVLTYLWLRAFLKLKSSSGTLRPVILMGLLIVIYGTGMEFVQKYLVALRSFDITDILADTAGVLLGIFVYKKLPATASARP